MPALLLAQDNPAQRVIFWCVVLLLTSVALAAFVFWIRRRMLDDSEPTMITGFSLADFREMHERGELSDEEFEAAKARLLARHRPAGEAEPDSPNAGDLAQTSLSAQSDMFSGDVSDEATPPKEPVIEPGDPAGESDPDKNPPEQMP